MICAATIFTTRRTMESLITKFRCHWMKLLEENFVNEEVKSFNKGLYNSDTLSVLYMTMGVAIAKYIIRTIM